MESSLQVRALTKRFAPDTAPVVDEVSFDVAPGEMFVLLGPSGCGKTTTLRMIGGFESPDSGSIQLGDAMLYDGQRELAPEQRQIGFVFQDYALFPHLTVEQNVGFGLRHLPASQRQTQIHHALELVGLARLRDRMPSALSGGEQQRIAVARALAPSPRFLLLDEPFSNLDESRRESMRLELRSLLKSKGISSLLVTHHQEEAMSIADRIGVMQQGRLQQVGTPREVYHQPTNAFVASFLGRTNLLRGDAEGHRADTPLGKIALDKRSKGSVRLSLRPEQLALSPVDDTQDAPAAIGQVLSSSFHGTHQSFRVQCEGVVYLVQSDNRSDYPPGSRVQLTVHDKAVVLAPMQTSAEPSS